MPWGWSRTPSSGWGTTDAPRQDSSLSLFFLAIFLLCVVFQAIVGHRLFNEDQITHADLLDEEPQTLSFSRYLVSSHFGQGLMENWQSEYLQFTLFVMATVWLLQRGSTDSKELDNAGTESDEAQMVGGHAQQNSPAWAKAAGFRRWVYSTRCCS